MLEPACLRRKRPTNRVEPFRPFLQIHLSDHVRNLTPPARLDDSEIARKCCIHNHLRFVLRFGPEHEGSSRVWFDFVMITRYGVIVVIRWTTGE